MPRLHQILAAERTVKKVSEATVTGVYHSLQVGALFTGVIRSYEPRQEGIDAEQLPGEENPVQRTVGQAVAEARAAWTEIADLTATKVYANTGARADIKIGDVIILPDVPVEYMLFLEKRLENVLVFIDTIPVLDPSATWNHSDNDPDGVYRANPIITIRTKKVPKVVTLAQATDKHQATTQVFEEDTPVGTWTRVQLSGAAERSQVDAWRRKVVALAAAVKMAREQANLVEAPPQQVGNTILSYIFG